MNFKKIPVLLAFLLFIYATVCTVTLMFYIHLSTLPGKFMRPVPEFLYKNHKSSVKNEKLDLEFSTGDKVGSPLPLIDFKDLGSRKKRVLLLIIVSTATQRFDRRQAIRDTWWKHCTGSQVRHQLETDKRV